MKMSDKIQDGEWEVMADPMQPGQNYFYDNRYVVTKGAKPIFGHDERSWALTDDHKIICEIGDFGEAETEEIARLIASAPKMKAALRGIIDFFDNSGAGFGAVSKKFWDDSYEALSEARKALDEF